jgi:hypothetical protein
VCDTDEMMDIKYGRLEKEDIYMTMEPYDF